MDVLDSLCQRMKLYQARAGPDFPYIKGGMEMIVLLFCKIQITYHYLKCLCESRRKKNLSS